MWSPHRSNFRKYLEVYMHQLNLRKEQMMLLKVILFFLFIALYLFITPSRALAHRVFLTAYVEGDAVFVEAGFSDGTLCKHSIIEVFDPSGKKLLEGKTDEKGGFSFKPPQKTDLKIILDAGMGHIDEYLLSADELPEITAESVEPLEETKSVAQIDSKEIELIVDRVIQKRLHPLIQLVAKSQRKTGVSATEIFGGIGYILGLAGIAIYFKSRKGDK